MVEQGYEVIACCLNVGENKDLTLIKEKALKVGASESIMLDKVDTFADEYLSYAIKGNSLYEQTYPLVSALSRPLIAKELVKMAQEKGAEYIAHGCTGKGNDQVRFEVAIHSIDPSLKTLAPVRDWGFSREAEIDYALKHDIPIPIDLDSPYSIDQNLWGRSNECGILEDPYAEPPEDAYELTQSIADSPDEPSVIELTFTAGVPTAINGEQMALHELIASLNSLGGIHGVGRITHVEMLAQCGILTHSEKDLIHQGLRSIEADYENGDVVFTAAAEDIHLNIEKLLIEKIGPTGGKMHTGRSRNDQVATDMHLYMVKEVNAIVHLIEQLQTTIAERAEENIDVIMPGYTHLQRAQPILFAHHIMSYFWMLQRDKERLTDSLKRISLSPLGAGALAGTTYPIDQPMTRTLLGFSGLYMNSMDAVSDRDYLLETMNNLNLIMMHLSRFSEEIILWCTHEFNFIALSDAFSTGSSIMPQKKNPDMAELIRGKAGTVAGRYMGLLMTMKGLPLAYNKDMQEDKKPSFEAVADTKKSLNIFNGMIRTMTLNKEEMALNDFSNATEFADYLVTLGVPFREAHALTGQLVYSCIQKNQLLMDVPLETYRSIHPSITEEVYTSLTPAAAVNRRQNLNGTGTDAVLQQIKEGKTLISR
nr:argininosuccinate lyase [Macrococcus bovicus]